MTKTSKAGKSSKTLCFESDFSEVGLGLCLDSKGNEYSYISYGIKNEGLDETNVEECIAIGVALFATKPGFVGVEVEYQSFTPFGKFRRCLALSVVYQDTSLIVLSLDSMLFPL